MGTRLRFAQDVSRAARRKHIDEVLGDLGPHSCLYSSPRFPAQTARLSSWPSSGRQESIENAPRRALDSELNRVKSGTDNTKEPRMNHRFTKFVATVASAAALGLAALGSAGVASGISGD